VRESAGGHAMTRLRKIDNLSQFPGPLSDTESARVQKVVEEIAIYFAKPGQSLEEVVANIDDLGSWGLIIRDPELCSRLNALSHYITHVSPWSQGHPHMLTLMVLFIALKKESLYMFRQHYRKAVDSLGIEPEKIAALKFYQTSSIFSKIEKDLLSFVESALDGDVADHIFDTVKDLYSEVEFLNFVVAIGYWNMWSTILSVTRYTKPSS
jgi:alkylhydroperoxidase family enzyme